MTGWGSCMMNQADISSLLKIIMMENFETLKDTTSMFRMKEFGIKSGDATCGCQGGEEEL